MAARITSFYVAVHLVGEDGTEVGAIVTPRHAEDTIPGGELTVKAIRDVILDNELDLAVEAAKKIDPEPSA